MEKIIRLLAILIIAISACGGSGGSVTHPIGYAGPDSSVAPLVQTASVYSETHYIYDFQGNNYLLSCNSNGVGSGQLEIYKDISGSFNTTEKMTIGGGIGCSGVTAIIDNNNSVFNSTNIGVLHIFATEDIQNADTFVTYWCWDGTWSAGGSLQGCGSSLPNTIGGGAPTAAIDTTNNTLLMAWQENFNDLNPASMELLLMDYPLANLQAGLYNFADWTNHVSIDGANGGFSAVGTYPVMKITGGSIVIIARADNAGLGLKLYHCLLASDCSDANNWGGTTQFIATNVADSFDFEINPSDGYLTLVYQSDSGGSLHPNGIVSREWSISTPLTAGPEKLIAMAYDPVNLAAAEISLGIEPNGKKHVFWWEHQAPFKFVLNHRFAKGNLWDGDIVTAWDGSSITDIPTRMNPVFDNNNPSTHGDLGFFVGYSKLDNGVNPTVQEFVVSTRYPTY